MASRRSSALNLSRCVKTPDRLRQYVSEADALLVVYLGGFHVVLLKKAGARRNGT